MRKLAKRMFGDAKTDQREHPRFPGGLVSAAANVRLGQTDLKMWDFSLPSFGVTGYSGPLIDGGSFPLHSA